MRFRFKFLIFILLLVALALFLVLFIKERSSVQNDSEVFLKAKILSGVQPFTDRIKQQFCRSSLIFVGDMMFDRGVEYYTKQSDSIYYPLEKMDSFLDKADITFGNLEGPIVASPPNFGNHSLQFAFATTTLKVLERAGFDVLSLANNHTFNMGAAGIGETRQFLADSNVLAVGDPISCSKEFAVSREGVAFFAVNKTFEFNCSDEEVLKNFQVVRDKFPDKFLIVSIHWGVEYQSKNSSAQKELAHKLIEAGVDLIIGHHPHVVQNIEEYQGKLIFYSLGNFIFDQYFSEPVKTGLAVELEVSDKNLIYTLHPVYDLQLAQPSLMQDKELFLKQLAEKSSPSLKEEIERGVIKKERSHH